MELLKKPTEEEAIELRERAQGIIELGYSEFQKLKPDLPGWSKSLMRFYMLPRSELHDKFDELIVGPDHSHKIAENEGRLRGYIKMGIKNFVSKWHLDDYQASSVKYKIVSKARVINHLSGATDEVLQIGIPYELNGIPKFGESVLIKKSEAPNVFEGVLSAYGRYNGDADFSFLSKF